MKDKDILGVMLKILSAEMPENLSAEERADHIARRTYCKNATFALRCENSDQPLISREMLEEKINAYLKKTHEH